MELISRERVIKEFQLMRPFTTDTMIENIITIINNAPTIENRPKGEWIYDGTTLSLDWYICSECKDYVNSAQEEGYRFCPYCGADMREGEE